MISFLPPSSLASSQTTQRMASSRPPPLLSFADNHNFCSFVLLCFCFCFSLLDPHLFMISPLIHCLFCKSCILSSSHSLFDHHFIATNPIQWLLQWRLCVVLGRKWFLRAKTWLFLQLFFPTVIGQFKILSSYPLFHWLKETFNSFNLNSHTCRELDASNSLANEWTFPPLLAPCSAPEHKRPNLSLGWWHVRRHHPFANQTDSSCIKKEV